MNFLKNSSAADDLFIYSRGYIIFVCRPICCWLSSLAVEYHQLWTIISYVLWCSSPADDIQLKQMILIWRGWYSSDGDDIHLEQTIFNWSRWYLSDGDDIYLEQTIFIRRKRYSFKRDEYHLWWLILEITIDHWRWNSTTGDHNQPLGMIIGQKRWYVVCSRWIISSAASFI
jgi:hypothetical protein